MFNKLSNKLKSRSGGTNGQKDKSFAYGKMQKPEDHSAFEGGLSDDVEHKSTEKEEDPEGNAGSARERPRKSNFNLGESVFPISGAKKSRVPDTQVNDAYGYASDEDLSFDDQSSRKSSVFPSSTAQEDWSYDDQSCRKSSAFASSSIQDDDIGMAAASLKGYEDEEEDFLEEFEDYFQNLFVDNIRKEQYPKLDLQRMAYLDYARCGLFSLHQVQEHMRVVLEEGPSLIPPETGFMVRNHYVPEVQDRLFRLLNADPSEYSIIFTSGFSASFPLIGQAFPFQRGSPLAVSQDNDPAVQKLINAAADKGASTILVPLAGADLSLNAHELRRILGRRGSLSSGNGGLFVFPAQSSASGVLHSFNWIVEAQQNGWHVLVDASTYLPAAGALNLSTYQPDLVLGCVSHLLGYPAGIGFLLVRRDTLEVQQLGKDNLRFVRLSDPSEKKQSERDCIVLDEDDTLNASTFAALSAGLAHLETMGYEAIRKRTRALVSWTLRALLSLRHKGDSGPHLAKLYGSSSRKNRGSIIAFSVLDASGTEFPVGLTRKIADKNNIFLGGSQLPDSAANLRSRRGSEGLRDGSIFGGNSKFFNAVRVSLGPATNFQDVYRFASLMSRFTNEDFLAGQAVGVIEDAAEI